MVGGRHEPSDLKADRRSAGRAHVVTFALLFASLAVWSVALPRFAAPDENRHVVKAWAVGHRDGGRVDPVDGARSYHVPGYLDETPPCFALKEDVPASCLPPDDGTMHDTVNGASSYPPLYYLLVAAPTLVSSGDTMLVLVRLVSAAWVALFLTIAIANLARLPRAQPFLPALLVVLGPVTFFLGATVNPSGLSIAAALAAWSAAIALMCHPPGARLGRHIDLIGLPLCVLLLLRRDAVIWTALIVAVMAVLCRPDVRSVLLRSRRAWLWAVAVAACAGLQASTSGAETASVALEGPRAGIRAVIGDVPYYLQQMLGGKVGWLDTLFPLGVYLLFDVVMIALFVGAIALGRGRIAVVMVGAALAVVSVPTALQIITDYGMQGRYVMPLAIGVPLLAGAALADRRRQGPRWSPRIGPVVATLFVVAQVVAFAWTLRRFTAGVHGPWWFQEAAPWSPTMGATMLVVLDALAFGASFGWLAWRFRGRQAPAVDEHAAPDRTEAPTVLESVG